MTINVIEIAEVLNQKSIDYEIGSLQDIRKNLKKHKNKAGSSIFALKSKTVTDKWACHYGGRAELQFNIGVEEDGLRYGVAFSLETNQTLPNINLLIPKIKKLNSLIEEMAEFFNQYEMWYDQKGNKSKRYQVRVIDSDLIVNETFIFIGKTMNYNSIDYDKILKTFDDFLPIYKEVEKELLFSKTHDEKLCILKPIMWNDKEYKEPAGYKSTGGYSLENGYGHEEWNNNDKWIWRNFRIFHTESQPALEEYANNGNLGIVMIASHEGNQYALGIATNVFINDPEEREIISRELNIYKNYHQLWQQETVRKSFHNELDKFLEHWKKDYSWIQWKCPKDNYFWFNEPIKITTSDFSGKGRLISMHSRYQKVLPEQILNSLSKYLKKKPRILEWLTSGEFNTESNTGQTPAKTNSVLRKLYLSNKANAPATREFSYWVTGQRTVEPLHAKLQAQFTESLFQRRLRYKENKNYVDVQYNDGDNTVFCEIKPTKNLDTKYAIRIAIGQLLEYRFLNKENAKLEIVIGSKPRKEEIEFVKSLDIKLTYFDELYEEFISF
ncbi:MAG: hypothetical protein WCT23_04330 [Candidatus Neomarinimicrobiota bacterium]|jgi:hypothetical protein